MKIYKYFFHIYLLNLLMLFVQTQDNLLFFINLFKLKEKLQKGKKMKKTNEKEKKKNEKKKK
jgi:hypothetical protein